MISAVSSLGSYGRVQWPSYGIPAQSGADTAAKNATIHAVGRGSDPEVPVQPVDAALPVTPKAAGSVSSISTASLSPQAGADAAEMAVRMRISPEESVQTVQGAEEKDVQIVGSEGEDKAIQGQKAEPENDIAAQQAERQAQAEERIQAEQEAQAKLEAYMEKLEEAEESRSERVAALQEALAEKAGGVNAEENAEEEGQQAEASEESEGTTEPKTGFLELDYTSAMLQNYQMMNLLRDQLAAQAEGKDTSGYRAAMDSLLQNSQERVRFVSGDQEDSKGGNYFLTGAA